MSGSSGVSSGGRYGLGTPLPVKPTHVFHEQLGSTTPAPLNSPPSGVSSPFGGQPPRYGAPGSNPVPSAPVPQPMPAADPGLQPPMPQSRYNLPVPRSTTVQSVSVQRPAGQPVIRTLANRTATSPGQPAIVPNVNQASLRYGQTPAGANQPLAAPASTSFIQQLQTKNAQPAMTGTGTGRYPVRPASVSPAVPQMRPASMATLPKLGSSRYGR
ncbi:MAG: hypothetical protein R3C19_06240 [Planctomycetaceae bacterium]